MSRQAVDITERRLRPVYDCLDASNPKKALQECDRLLKKQPDFSGARALKALSLLRLNRRPEAWAILHDLEALTPREEYTLQALTYCYKDLQCPERIVTLYENVIKKQSPANEDLLTHWFMACVRVGDYSKQHQAAMQLYKTCKKNPYYFWAVMSLIIQGVNDPLKGETLSFPLALKMVQKFINEKRIEAEAEVLLHLLLLRQMNKWDEYLDALKSPLCDELLRMTWNRELLIIDTLKRLGRLDQVYTQCLYLLRHEQWLDQWSLYDDLIHSVFTMNDPTKISDVQNFLLTQVERARMCKRTPRGPFLAQFEFALRAQVDWATLATLLNTYVTTFVTCPSCVTDLRPLLSKLCVHGSEHDFTSIFHDLEAVVEKQASTNDRIVAHIAVKHIQFILGSGILPIANDRQQFLSENAKAIFLQYHDELVKIENTPVAERTISLQMLDGYAMLLAQILWTLFHAGHTPDFRLLIESLALLEQAMLHSTSNYILKYVAARFYGYLGASDCVFKLAESMEIKYFQRESLGYLFHPNFSTWGMFEDAVIWAQGVHVFYKQSDREMGENLIQAYKAGAFPKILEFVEFRKKLQKALYCLVCAVDEPYFVLVSEAPGEFSALSTLLNTVAPANFHLDFGDIMDTRDFCVFESLDDTCNVKNLAREKSLQELVVLLKFRHQVVRLLASLARSKTLSDHAASEKDADGVLANGCENNLIETKLFDSLVQEVTQARATDFTYPLCLGGPGPQYFNVYLKGRYFEVLQYWIELALLRSPQDMLSENSSNECQKVIRDMIAVHQLFQNTRVFPYMQLCHLSYCVQTLAYCSLFAVVAFENVKPFVPLKVPPGKKGKKKEKQAQTEQPVEIPEQVQRFAALVQMLDGAFGSLGRLLADLETLLETDIVELSLIEPAMLVSVDASCKATVSKKLKDSYMRSIRSMSDLCQKQSEAIRRMLAAGGCLSTP